MSSSSDPGKNAGFTLVELLIVIAIIGILAAIAIPNLLNALQRGKQKRTMIDIRELATAIASYQVDVSLFPDAACVSGLYTAGYPGTAIGTGSFLSLVPSYLAQPPRVDGWGNFFNYNVDAPHENYLISSFGRDKTQGSLVCGTTTNFNDDIVYSNGAFMQWPEGAQQ